ASVSGSPTPIASMMPSPLPWRTEIMKIRRFNASGLAKFADYLSQKTRDKAPPVELLDDPTYSEDAQVDGDLEQQVFDSTFDLGMAVCSAVGTKTLPKPLRDDAVWSWPSLYFNESTMPRKHRIWFLGDKSRHILGKNKAAWKEYDHHHRHLVRGAVQAVFQFNDRARVL